MNATEARTTALAMAAAAADGHTGTVLDLWDQFDREGLLVLGLAQLPSTLLKSLGHPDPAAWLHNAADAARVSAAVSETARRVEEIWTSGTP